MSAPRFLPLAFAAVSGLAAAGLGATPARAATISVTYDSTVTSNANSTSIQTAFNAVASQFGAAISNAITVNIKVSWGQVNTTALASGDVAETLQNAQGFYTFAQTKSYLTAGGVTASLPTTDPTGTGLFLIPNAEAKTLGIISATASGFDAYIGFSNSLSFDFDDSNGVTSGAYDFRGVAQHEMEHALGRVTGLTSASPIYAYAADLYRFTGTGTRNFVYNTGSGTKAYASIDNGVTKLGTYADESSGGDRSDWDPAGNVANAAGTSRDGQTAILTTGRDYCLSTADQRLMTGLGYVFTSSASSLYISGSTCAPTGAVAAAYAAVSTPEPASLGIFAVGAAAIGWARRRRR